MIGASADNLVAVPHLSKRGILGQKIDVYTIDEFTRWIKNRSEISLCFES